MGRLSDFSWTIIPLLLILLNVIFGIKEYLKGDKDEAKGYFGAALIILILVGVIIGLVFLFKFLFTTGIVEGMLGVIALLLLAILITLWLL